MSVEISPFRSRFLPSVLQLLATALPYDPISEARFTLQVLLDLNFREQGAVVARCEGHDGQHGGFAIGLSRNRQFSRWI